MKTKFKWLSGLRSSPCFHTNIVKSSDGSAYQVRFVSPNNWNKLFYIYKEAVRFGSNLIFQEKFPQCAENILCYVFAIIWHKYAQDLCVSVFETFQTNPPFIGFLGFEICCYLQQLEFVYCLSFECTSKNWIITTIQK